MWRNSSPAWGAFECGGIAFPGIEELAVPMCWPFSYYGKKDTGRGQQILVPAFCLLYHTLWITVQSPTNFWDKSAPSTARPSPRGSVQSILWGSLKCGVMKPRLVSKIKDRSTIAPGKWTAQMQAGWRQRSGKSQGHKRGDCLLFCEGFLKSGGLNFTLQG